MIGRPSWVTLLSVGEKPVTVPSFWARKKTREVEQNYEEKSEYGNLINNWIPQQEDSGILMVLFIRLGFDATLFLGVMMGFASERAIAILLANGMSRAEISKGVHKRTMRLINQTKVKT